jgi:FkbM family methyltransferase
MAKKMSLKKIIKKIIKSNNSVENSAQTFRTRLENMKMIGFSPRCIFDCGASVGYWSYDIGKLFPGSQIVAIEPNDYVYKDLVKNLSKIHPKAIIEKCALGERNGLTHLNIWDNDHTKMSGSSLKEHVQGEPKIKLQVKLSTIDDICSKHGVRPDLLKLDLQGGEIDALKGARETLKFTEVVITEFGCLPAYIDRTTPLDLMKVLYENDYCLYDIIDLIYRPYDNALTGGDFLFVKNNSPLKEYKGYS